MRLKGEMSTLSYHLRLGFAIVIVTVVYFLRERRMWWVLGIAVGIALLLVLQEIAFSKANTDFEGNP